MIHDCENPSSNIISRRNITTLHPLYTNEMNYEYHRERIRNLQISSVTDIILALSVIVILVFIGYYIFVVIHLKFN